MRRVNSAPRTHAPARPIQSLFVAVVFDHFQDTSTELEPLWPNPTMNCSERWGGRADVNSHIAPKRRRSQRTRFVVAFMAYVSWMSSTETAASAVLETVTAKVQKLEKSNVPVTERVTTPFDGGTAT